MNNDRLYKDARDFLLQCKKSSKSYDSTKQPFFIKNLIENADIGFDTVKVNEILENIPLPDRIKKIYQIAGCNDTEYYYKKWTLLSLNKIKSIYDDYKQKEQFRAVDFSIMYGGMGYVIVCCYDYVTDKIYYKLGGGSNSYDSQTNYEFACKYVPKETELFDIQHWLDTINDVDLMFYNVPIIKQ